MRFLIGLAAPLVLAAASAAPASAQGSSGGGGFALSSAPDVTEGWVSHVRVHRGFDGDRDRGRHRRGGAVLLGDWGYGGAWALYNNRGWRPDSYNDWWHDRPERSFPRWMSRNDDCAKPWYSGNVLRC